MQTVVLHLLYGILLRPCVFGRVDEYYFINIRLSWGDAQRFCRTHYTDLATVETLDDMSRISLPYNVWSWIGLTDDPVSWRKVMNSDSNSWRWSVIGTPGTSRYQNWGSADPNDAAGLELCVFIENGLWYDFNCASSLWFACYTDEAGTKKYFVITSALTWANARTYCRQHYLDLAMVENSTENQALTAVLPKSTASVWIGLYRVPWRWSDNSNSSFRRWLSGEPNNAYGAEYCASQKSDYVWNDASCATANPFVCHKILKRASTKTQMRLLTSADISDPALSDQILRQFEERLESKGISFTLSWTTSPTKENTEATNQDVCTVQNNNN